MARMTNIAKNLKKLRAAKKLSQGQVSIKTGITRSSYSGYENNIAEPNLCTVIKLAQFYDTTIEELIK